MPVSAQVGQEVNQRKGFVGRLIPVAGIGTPLLPAGLHIDDLGAAHAGLIHDAEVGVGFRQGGPGIASQGPDDHRVGALQVFKPQVAREANENSLRIVLGQVR